MSKSGTSPTENPSSADTTMPVGASRPGQSAETVAAPVLSGGATRPAATHRPKEIGGPGGPEPTRFGDWERDGRCVDF
jgi:hypothetical protein